MYEHNITIYGHRHQCVVISTIIYKLTIRQVYTNTVRQLSYAPVKFVLYS
jgi:hypothetical protein